MTNFQVQNNTTRPNVSYEATSAQGVINAGSASLEQYQRRNSGVTTPTSLKENDYKGLLSAEASYAMASFNLKNSKAISSYNFVAKQNGYGKVNMTHRHDLDFSYAN